MSTANPGARQAVEAAIPHRDPFLFVDRVLEESDETLTAEWDVPADADWFRGHYPGQPVLPGVLISEHVFQTAAILVSHHLGGLDPEAGVPVLSRIEDARFRRMVEPGATLTTTVQVGERLGAAWYMSGKVTCAGKKVLQVKFALTIASEDA